MYFDTIASAEVCMRDIQAVQLGETSKLKKSTAIVYDLIDPGNMIR